MDHVKSKNGNNFFIVWCFNMPYNVCVYETFGISKHFPVKLQLLLIRAVPLDNALTAKCFIHVVSRSVFIFPVIFSFNLLLRFGLPCVGTDTLFDKFWACGWLFERLGNVCGCEALEFHIILLFSTQSDILSIKLFVKSKSEL
jgi:hypothetical protein